MGVEMTGRRCDVCKVAGAHLFCKADMAYLCTDCDGKIHGANKLAIRHERVWMCEVCEQAPASVTCKADAAALCVSCDVDIHSANPLARRHERIPIVPFYDVIVSKPIEQMEDEDDDDRDEELDGEEAVSWLLPNPNPCSNPKTVDYFFSDVDPYLDLDYNSTMEAKLQANSDSIVPSKQTPSYSFGTESLSHSLSSSSTEIGLVPEADVSNPFPGAKPGVDCFPSPTANTTTQLSGLDREARVLRYREKRKNRKFEKQFATHREKLTRRQGQGLKADLPNDRRLKENSCLPTAVTSPVMVGTASFRHSDK